MKIAICQINSKVADFDGNVVKMLDFLGRARSQGADVALFPELSVFGYPPRDLLERPYLIEANIRAARKIARHTDRHLAAVFGYVEKNPGAKGRGLLNVACLAYEGKIQHIQPKTLLPSYDVFDEVRHFDPALKHELCFVKETPIGLTVCEDIWASFDFDGRRPYLFDPVQFWREKKIRLLLNISASPFYTGKYKERRELFKKAARIVKAPLVYCNAVGANDELVFDGQSMVLNSDGELLYEAKRFVEELTVVDLARKKPLSEESAYVEVEEVCEALIVGLREYLSKCGFQKVVIGLSGGIDSAVVAALAVRALGRKQVLGVAMPSRYSSAHSLQDAKRLAQNLGIPFRIIPIDSVYQKYLESLHLEINKNVPLAAENIQSRIRGNLLMALSNQSQALVLSTGNKSELSCGYCTLYGDLAGGLAILSDVPKLLVYTLGCFLNKNKKVIPESTFKKPPSAELKPDQKDEDSLPPYSILDPILKAYIEDHLSASEIIALGFSKKIVLETIHRIDRNEYKRRQAPPGIKVTSKAFGMGRRFPIAWEHA